VCVTSYLEAGIALFEAGILSEAGLKHVFSSGQRMLNTVAYSSERQVCEGTTELEVMIVETAPSCHVCRNQPDSESGNVHTQHLLQLISMFFLWLSPDQTSDGKITALALSLWWYVFSWPWWSWWRPFAILRRTFSIKRTASKWMACEGSPYRWRASRIWPCHRNSFGHWPARVWASATTRFRGTVRRKASTK
jgi:hypothetical protein